MASLYPFLGKVSVTDTAMTKVIYQHLKGELGLLIPVDDSIIIPAKGSVPEANLPLPLIGDPRCH